MRVEALRTLGFRNLADAEIALGPGVTLLWGPNGAGKTNALEALYFALTGRSCRTRAEREAIAFGQPLARAEAELHDGPERRTLLAAIERDGTRRRLVNGVPLPSSESAVRPPVAVFMPDRLTLVKGPPGERRSHLDGFAVALRPAATEPRRRFARALAQRNALLARIRRGEVTLASLDAWDAELAGAGIELMASRAATVETLAGPFADAAAALGLHGDVRCEYRPRSDAQDAEALRVELAERRAADLARGYTGHGPHLDELALLRDGRALRRYGSQGEQRAALLALLLAEREALLEARRTPPLLLLDDVMSELDPGRRELLCERLVARGGQVLVTATEAEHLPAGCERHEVPMRGGTALRAAGEAAA